MSLLGDFVKVVFYMIIASWILSIIFFFVMGQTKLAVLLLTGFIIPLFMIVYVYLKNRKRHSLSESR